MCYYIEKDSAMALQKITFATTKELIPYTYQLITEFQKRWAETGADLPILHTLEGKDFRDAILVQSYTYLTDVFRASFANIEMTNPSAQELVDIMAQIAPRQDRAYNLGKPLAVMDDNDYMLEDMIQERFVLICDDKILPNLNISSFNLRTTLLTSPHQISHYRKSYNSNLLVLPGDADFNPTFKKRLELNVDMLKTFMTTDFDSTPQNQIIILNRPGVMNSEYYKKLNKEFKKHKDKKPLPKKPQILYQRS